MIMLTIPEVELPVETDYKTLQVIEGIKRLKDLVPTIKDCRTVEEVQHIKHSCNLIQTYAQLVRHRSESCVAAWFRPRTSRPRC